MITNTVENGSNVFQPQEDSLSDRRVDPQKRGKTIYLLGPSDLVTVEYLAQEHCKKLGFTGIWSEVDYS